MSTQPNALSKSRASLHLQYPMSLGRYDKYEEAQKAVDYLADEKFEVQKATGRMTGAAWIGSRTTAPPSRWHRGQDRMRAALA